MSSCHVVHVALQVAEHEVWFPASQALISCLGAVSVRQRGSVSRVQEMDVRRAERVSCVTGSESGQRTHLWHWRSHMVCWLADDCGHPWLGVPKCSVAWTGQKTASGCV